VKRSILLSVLIIGAVAALVGAGSWAAFTDSGTASGTVTAGTVDIKLNGSDTASLTFSSAPGCPNAMAPGDSCTATVTVTNGNSSLALDYTIGTPTVTPSNSSCTSFSASVTSPTDTAGDPGHMPAGAPDSETFDVTVTLASSAGNECQGASATVSVPVNATQDIANPHDADDTHGP
jgi:spore coat-associated protein N